MPEREFLVLGSCFVRRRVFFVFFVAGGVGFVVGGVGFGFVALGNRVGRGRGRDG